MIQDGRVKAKLDAKEKMISFIDTAASSSAQSHGDEAKESEYLEIVEELERQNKRIVELMQQIESVDTNIQTTNAYVRKTLFGKDGGGARED